MKKAIAVLLVCVLCFGLAGCQGQSREYKKMLEQLDEIKEVSESYRRWSNGSRDADMEPIYIARTISLGEKLDALWIELSDDEKLEMLNYILDNSALLDTMVYLTEILAPRARQFDPDGFIALMLLAED